MLKTIFSLLIFSAAGFAQTKGIDFSQRIVGLDNLPLLNDSKSKPDKPVYLTLADVAVIALETQLQEDQASTGADKFKRDELARKVYEAKKISLPIEELATIKERIGKVFSAGVVGAAWRLLEPK